ncbi:MAG: serine/threonine-protein kinase, partial [Planctomycetaceae bacterium]
MDCPSQKQLVGYVTGGQDLHSHERIEEHVDTCSVCHETVILLDKSTENPFVGRPGRMSPSLDQDGELHALVQRAMPLGSRGGPASSIGAAGGESEMLAPGTELGPYVVEEAIGAGGMGQVYRAGHSRMKRQVALKVLAPELVGSDSARHRFQREIETVGQLRHPNIVTAYDAGEADGRCFLVLELVSGCSLDEVVRNDGPLPVDVAADVILQAAQGLRCAHQ